MSVGCVGTKNTHLEVSCLMPKLPSVQPLMHPSKARNGSKAEQA